MFLQLNSMAQHSFSAKSPLVHLNISNICEYWVSAVLSGGISQFSPLFIFLAFFEPQTCV